MDQLNNTGNANRLSRRTFVVGGAALASMAVIGTLTGCGESEEEKLEDEVEEEIDVLEEEAIAEDLGLVNEGKLTVGSDCDTPPFIYMEGDQAAGFEYDMMAAIADQIGLEINFLPPQNFDTLVASIAAGGIMDVACDNMTITDARKEEVDFSDPYMDLNTGLIVRQDSGIESSEELNHEGMRVGVQSGTTGQDWALENIPEAECVSFPDVTTTMLAVVSGEIDGAVMDLQLTLYYVKNSYPECAVVEEIPTGEQAGIAVSKDNPALLNAINKGLHAIMDDGTFDTLYDEYFTV